MKATLILTLAILLTACGGGAIETPEPADKGSRAWRVWLWETEGGDPAEFTEARFCAVQPEHCAKRVDL